MKIKFLFLIPFVLLFSVFSSFDFSMSQSPLQETLLGRKEHKQTKLIPQNLEKIYAQTDRTLYFPGEMVWFKAYLTKSDNTIATLSDVMYADLISPKGSVVKTLRLKVENGSTYGDFLISNAWVGGIYTLKIYTNWLKNFGEEAYFKKEITIQKIVEPNLLMKLDFEKEAYGKAGKVVANFEIKDLKNNPLANHKINYVVKLAGQEYLNKKLKTNAQGKLNIAFTLPNDLASSDVLLNVLIPYKGSTESIARSVPVVLENVDLQFFAESGFTIYNTTNTIAFKAIDEFGKPVDVVGDILDERGVVCTNFESYHDGMGSFDFEPKRHQKYFAKIKQPFQSEDLIPLTGIKKEGVKFSLVKNEKDQISLDIFSTKRKTILVHIANASKLLYKKKIHLKGGVQQFEIDTKDFPIGIHKITLLEKSAQILCERLAFIHPDKQLNIELSLDKETYETREKVKVKIKTTDANGKPIPANLSLSVADNKLLSFADDKQANILSTFLLSTELKGKIHEPNFYFDKKEDKAIIALDYLMLTHGWRSYIVDERVDLKKARNLPEQNNMQTGVVLDENKKPIKAHLLLFEIYNNNKVLKFNTNEKGKFSVNIEPNKHYTLMAYRKDKAKLWIEMNQQLPIVQKRRMENKKVEMDDFAAVDKPMQNPIKEEAKIDVSLEEGLELSEVVVTCLGVSKEKRTLGYSVVTVSGEVNNRTLAGKATGIEIVESEMADELNTSIVIRGMNSIVATNSPLFIVDGIPFNSQGADVNALLNFDPSSIASVKILKGASATILYGASAANGVIEIMTKNKDYSYSSSKTINFKKFNNYTTKSFYNYGARNSFNQAQQFYMPVYGKKFKTEERNDFRQTIYWNPVIETGANGKASFEFYCSDAITSFQIITEGVSANGLLGRLEKSFNTKKLLTVDFKLPNYLTIQDTVILVATITNETDKNVIVDLQTKFPKEIKLLSKEDFKNITIPAHSFVLKNIAILPIQKSDKTKIGMSIKSEYYTDLVQREATILSPYFPTETSMSGTNNKTFTFDINNVVTSSLSGEFTVYTDIIGDVMNGIESLISQPYGCFEQVSSTTYPNILVLQYLQETGKNNPTIEKKAMDFIDQGYKKLAAYETKEDGFEWYGQVSPHETLSAYGLLEFTEMTAVYNGVDDEMINRTLNWLLKRRDNKGGFKKSKGLYGFSSTPKDVANAYIVYAMSEAKVDVDLEKEYQKAVKDALKSEDAYKLALMACASFNYNEKENANLLLEKIKNNIERYNFDKLPVNNTITRSYGNAKNLETVAFTILALLKEGQSDYLVTQAVEYLLGKREYGRFGSTQSTAMSLKALIEYSKTQKSKFLNQNHSFELIVNGQSIKRDLKLNDQGKISIKGIEKYITTGQQVVQIIFNDPDQSFPYSFDLKWDSKIPNSSKQCKVNLITALQQATCKVGENPRLTIEVQNKEDNPLAMTTAIIGIPSGTTPQPWQLKELLEKKKVAYYEIFDNYLVFYWKELGPSESKIIHLDLKADIAGHFQAPASTVYLYYGDENKHWVAGNHLTIQ